MLWINENQRNRISQNVAKIKKYRTRPFFEEKAIEFR